MRDKRVGDLPAAEEINNGNFFVVEQDGIAKKIAAEVLKGFIDWARNGIPAGGKENQILIKTSDEDYELKWVSVLDDRGFISPLLMPLHFLSTEDELPPSGTVPDGHVFIVDEGAEGIKSKLVEVADPDLWEP